MCSNGCRFADRIGPGSLSQIRTSLSIAHTGATLPKGNLDIGAEQFERGIMGLIRTARLFFLERGLMRVLLVEDDAGIASFVVKGLKEAGYRVERVEDGQTGLDRLMNDPFDGAIVDIMLPVLDGLTLIQRAREHRVSTPVLILSARGTVDDRVAGLQHGGDDYLVKPFAFAELLARLQALMRRAHRISEPTHLAVGPLDVDLIRRKVARDGHVIELQPLEFALLEYLMRNAGRVVSKTMIMEHVWDYNFDPQTNVVEARICRLRDKIDRDFDAKLIHTIRGAGYVLEERA